MKIEYWSQPVGWIMALLLLGGTVAAILTLTGRIGINRKSEGTISQLKFYPALKVLETTIVMDKAWKGHTAGQFAFVTTDKKRGLTLILLPLHGVVKIVNLFLSLKHLAIIQAG